MKKIIIVFLLAFISTASSFMIPTVHAQDSPSIKSLIFKGFGAWRDKDNKAGQYRTHKDILWSECRNKCINSRSCTGVEYFLRVDGQSMCEIHTGKFHRVVNVAHGIGATTVWVKPTIDETSVQSLSLKPVDSNIRTSCPATVKFEATIQMKHTVKGDGFLVYENGQKSNTFQWSANEGQKVTSTVSRKFEGRPGVTNNGWAVMKVQWNGSDGAKHTKDSNKAAFSVRCTGASERMRVQ
jgi:hypothetical protein